MQSEVQGWAVWDHSIVRSQDWRGRPLGRRQSTGKRSVDARSAREWSSEAICPNSLRRCCCISERKPGIGWFVTLYRYVSNVCSIWDAKHKHHWSKASRRFSTLLSHSMCPSHIGAPEEYKLYCILRRKCNSQHCSVLTTSCTHAQAASPNFGSKYQ